MKKWTKELLEESGYKIENAQIESVRLTMADHGVLTSDLALNGHGWGVCYGGYVLGKGYLGSKDFEGYGSGMEAIMRIMDTVGVEEYGQMKGKFVRVATKGLGSSVRIIGNILDDKWFDYESFFADLTDEQVQKIICIGNRYWEMVGQFKNEDMTPDEFADYITAKSEQVEKELIERWN